MSSLAALRLVDRFQYASARARREYRRRPSDSPTRALARRFAGALRSRGSFAALTRTVSQRCHRWPRYGLWIGSSTPVPELVVITRGASPLGLPETRTRAPLRRRGPFAWLARCAHSHRVSPLSSLAA